MFNVGQKWNTDGDQKYILHILHRAQVLILNVSVVLGLSTTCILQLFTILQSLYC